MDGWMDGISLIVNWGRIINAGLSAVHNITRSLCVACDCHRCPTTDVLDLLFYSSQQLSWGVRFAVPKYQAFDSLYVACSAYICDSAAESSEHCDRSCVGLEPTATRRSQTGGRSRRSRGASTQQLHMQTHFTVADEGFGPLIDNYGQLRLIDHTR